MTDAQPLPHRGPWNWLFWIVVITAGFFTLLGPILYFWGFTESDPEYRLIQTVESPDEAFLADALHYRQPGQSGVQEESIIVELRSKDTEIRKGFRVFVADQDLYRGHRWANPKTLIVEYKVSQSGRKPDRMVSEGLGIKVRYEYEN